MIETNAPYVNGRVQATDGCERDWKVEDDILETFWKAAATISGVTQISQSSGVCADSCDGAVKGKAGAFDVTWKSRCDCNRARLSPKRALWPKVRGQDSWIELETEINHDGMLLRTSFHLGNNTGVTVVLIGYSCLYAITNNAVRPQQTAYSTCSNADACSQGRRRS